MLNKLCLSRQLKLAYDKKYPIVFDCDGVLTASTTYYNNDGNVLRRFSIYDGTGFKFLRTLGLSIHIASTDITSLCNKRSLDLSVNYIDCSIKYKPEALKLAGIKEYIFVGDDIGDYTALSSAFISFCPSTAPPYTKSIVDYILESPGGHGVALELSILIANSIEIEIKDLITQAQLTI